jgi:hypothetical protein
MELLLKTREELDQHHSQLVQARQKFERTVFKNAKLEDSFSATKRELEEFKRKDLENAKAIKQVCLLCFGIFAFSYVSTLDAGPIYGTGI